MPPDLFVICLAAFIAVFALLSFLAVVMRILVVAFPKRMSGDPTMIAAVTAAVSMAYPGTMVTKIEEIR